MEIERKFLVPCLSGDYDTHPFHQIERTYLCTDPVIRIRQEDEDFCLTYKGKGLLSRKEYNLPLTREVYVHLLPKADGSVLTKKRYFVPLDNSNHLIIELGVFEDHYAGLILAEVEFTAGEEVLPFQPPKWFGRDITFIREYQNSGLAYGRQQVQGGVRGGKGEEGVRCGCGASRAKPPETD